MDYVRQSLPYPFFLSFLNISPNMGNGFSHHGAYLCGVLVDKASDEKDETHKHRMEMRKMMMPKSKEELFKVIDRHVRV